MAQQVTPWQVLKQRDFGLFWASLLFSAVGSQISTVAIAWQVYEITNSPFQLGLAGLFRALPIMLLSIPGGVLADRMDRRRLLIVTQSLAALLGVRARAVELFRRRAGLAYLRRDVFVGRRGNFRLAGAHSADSDTGAAGATGDRLRAQHHLAPDRHALRSVHRRSHHRDASVSALPILSTR